MMSNPQRQNNKAILLCRISSDKQAEGYSLDFQEKGGIKYAERCGFTIDKIWKIVESAMSKDGRDKWQNFLERVQSGPEQHILIPKVDRSLRNFDDLAMIAKIPKLYDKTLHFFDDGLILHKDSPASDLLRLGVQGVVATWYSVDLSQKTKRGMDEKASQGEFPGRAPYGYMNNKATKLLDVDPDTAHWVKRIKELSAVGLYSLDKIKDLMVEEGYPIQRHRLHRNLIERIIRNPIYAGYFEWQKGSGNLILGKHPSIVDWELHEKAVQGLERYNKPKYSKHNFPFSGLMRCGMCDKKLMVTFEMKKGKYLYARCARIRKELCPHSKWVRSEILEAQFIQALKNISLTDEMGKMILSELSVDSGQEAASQIAQETLLKQEIGRLEGRIKNAYLDKLDGKIDADQWSKFNGDWQLEKVRLEEKRKALESSGPASYLPTARMYIELVKSLEKQYFLASAEEKRQLLNAVISNCFLKGENIEFSYKKPFDLFAQMGQNAKTLPIINEYRTWLTGENAIQAAWQSRFFQPT